MSEADTLRTQKYLLLREFVGKHEEADIVKQVIACHERKSKDFVWHASATSQRLDLGISCGESLHGSTPEAVAIARRAFSRANNFVNMPILQRLAKSSTPLSGTALLYGPEATMPAHYDSPTQPGQREEWLCVLSFGLSARFRCNEHVLHLHSGDALVMDSMAILHGIDGIVNDAADGTRCRGLGLPSPSRLGIVLWQARPPSLGGGKSVDEADEAVFDGMDMLFSEEEQ